MVRTQIQLTEDQSRALKKLAITEGKSIAELIRLSVDEMLALKIHMDVDERRKRALAAVGKFHTGDSDLSQEHDRYLAEAYSQ